MRGTTLFPLARLAAEAPDLHAAAARKYAGREWLPDLEIPALACRWRDVVFLSQLSPRVIFAELVRLGRRAAVPSWFAIPTGRVRGSVDVAGVPVEMFEPRMVTADRPPEVAAPSRARCDHILQIVI